jgi:CheY-like chemotaxis protein
MIVDDVEINIMALMQRLLQISTYRIDSACSGHEALNKVHAFKCT